MLKHFPGYGNNSDIHTGIAYDNRSISTFNASDFIPFDGVVITDDLAMEGVKQFAGDTEIAVRAVQAGNDLLCCTEFKTQIPAVIDAVKAGTISEERIDESVERILKLKIELGIIEA